MYDVERYCADCKVKIGDLQHFAIRTIIYYNIRGYNTVFIMSQIITHEKL